MCKEKNIEEDIEKCKEIIEDNKKTIRIAERVLKSKIEKEELIKQNQAIENILKDRERLQEKNSINKDIVKKYIDKKIKSIDKLLNEMLDENIEFINVSCLSKKEKEEVINKRNCLLVQKKTLEQVYEELLKEKR